MKSLISALLLSASLVACSEKSSSNNTSRERNPVCGGTKEAACLPRLHWTLQTNLRPLDFMATVAVNGIVILDECNGIHLPSVHVPEHRRSVLIENWEYASEDESIHVKIDSWDESCTVRTEFYENSDTPILVIREEGQQARVVLDLDR